MKKKAAGTWGSKMVDIIENGRVVERLPCILDIWTKGHWPHYVNEGMTAQQPDCVAYLNELQAKGRAVLFPARWKDGEIKRVRPPTGIVVVRNVAFTDRGLELDIDLAAGIDRDVV